MDLKEAVMQRRSIRVYLPRPVPRAVIEGLLETARWSPSAMNSQAWHVAVASGKPLKELSQALIAAFDEDSYGHPEIPMPKLPPVIHERRRALGYKIYEIQGASPKDPEKRLWWSQEMLRFFRAPAALVIHAPRSMCPYVLPDMGLFAMTIMLLATDKGLSTCPMMAPAAYPEVIRERLHIPDDHLIAMCLAMGYPDSSSPLNQFPRQREPVSGFTTWFE